MSDNSTAILVASVLLLTVPTLAVAMRLWVRTAVLHGVGWDDALILLSWAMCMAFFAACLAARSFGFGKHMDELSALDVGMLSRLLIVCSTTYSWAVPAAKASFAVLYLRILQGRFLAVLNRAIIVFLALQAIEETLVVVFQCQPVARAWDPSVPGHCHGLVPLWWCTFVFNIVTDLTLFIEPMPSIWHLQLPLMKRIGIIVMLSLGLLVCVISVIRIVFVSRIGADSSYEYAEPIIWSGVEIAALILCSCIPSLRQVLQRTPWISRLLGLSSASGRDTAAGYNNGPYDVPMSGSKRSKRHTNASKAGARNGSNGASIALYSRNGTYNDPFDPVGYGGSDTDTAHHLGRVHLSRGRHHPFGMVSRVEPGGGADTRDPINRLPSEDGSTDEIFPASKGGGGSGDGGAAAKVSAATAAGSPNVPAGSRGGGILVTRDFKHDVELSHAANSTVLFTEDGEDGEDEEDGARRASESR